MTEASPVIDPSVLIRSHILWVNIQLHCCAPLLWNAVFRSWNHHLLNSESSSALSFIAFSSEIFVGGVRSVDDNVSDCMHDYSFLHFRVLYCRQYLAYHIWLLCSFSLPSSGTICPHLSQVDFTLKVFSMFVYYFMSSWICLLAFRVTMVAFAFTKLEGDQCGENSVISFLNDSWLNAFSLYFSHMNKNLSKLHVFLSASILICMVIISNKHKPRKLYLLNCRGQFLGTPLPGSTSKALWAVDENPDKSQQCFALKCGTSVQCEISKFLLI